MPSYAPRWLYLTVVFACILFLITLKPKSQSVQPTASDTQEAASSPPLPPKPPQQHPKRPTENSDPHLHERISHAETLWKQSVAERDKMINIYVHLEQAKFPDDFINPFTVWDFVRPAFFCPHDLERVGRAGDGGKWVCGMTRYEAEFPAPSSSTVSILMGTTKDESRPPMTIYSFGVNDDSSFEAAMLRRTNAEIWGYDMTVNSWADEAVAAHAPNLQQDARAHFQKAKITGISIKSHNPPIYNIQDLMSINGHDYIDILKMDIEGSEFDVLTSLIDFISSSSTNHKPSKNSNPKKPSIPIGQLLVEFHFIMQPYQLNMPQDLLSWISFFERLEQVGLRPVMNEENWHGNDVFGKPRFMEYTFVNVLETDKNVLLWG